MRYLKKIAASCLLIGTCLMTTTAYAETKINSVSIRLESEGFDEWGNAELTAEGKNGHYSVSDVTHASEHMLTSESYSEDSNVYVIDLYAEDGYYFNITKADKIHLTGLGADFVKASRQNNGSELYITVKLTGLGSFVGEIEEAKWESDGHGIWDEAIGAKTYTVSISDDHGKAKRAQTLGTSYDFRPFMQKAGTYEFKVRPYSATGEYTDWTDAGSLTVTAEMAEKNRELFEVKKEVTYQDGIKTPDKAIVEYKNIGWQTNEEGKMWYRNQDGSYPQSSWMMENDTWYYFDKDGIMQADAYVQIGASSYYFDENGRMIANQKAPDGRKADKDGSLS